jgi:hypothetical protein
MLVLSTAQRPMNGNRSAALSVAAIAAWLVAGFASAVDFDAQYVASAPVYLFKDAAGNAYALQLPGAGDSTLGRYYVTSDELAALARLGATIAYLPEHPDAAIGPCTANELPRDFNIAFLEGIVFGNVAQCAPGARPSFAHGQIIDLVVFTQGYARQAAHTVIIPWFKNALHGHGIYFGDTAAFPCATGEDATFNTRIEGWSQWSGFGPSRTAYWTSTGPLERETCGTPLTDGWTSGSGAVTAAFEVSVRATDDQWVRYSVQRWDGSHWLPHTAPLVRDMRYTDWPNGPGTFDPTANGLLVGSTGPLGAASGSQWLIGIRELSSAWSRGWESAALSSALEFYDPALDHYFMTADATEISDLDHGMHSGWTRTGHAFAVGSEPAAYAEPVCRFYGLPSAGLDSHFYSANAGECENVKLRFADAWSFESSSVFAAALPDTVTGECPAQMQPVYRLWNARKDSNHRYTTDASVRQGMLARGFVAEGYGAQGVAMCSPLR